MSSTPRGLGAESEPKTYAKKRRDRWQHVVGQFGAGPVVVALTWNHTDDHRQLITFAIVHHLTVWLMALPFIMGLGNRNRRFPIGGIVGVATCHTVLSCALWFNPGAARESAFAPSVGMVIYACVAGALAIHGVKPSVLRLVATCLLVPFVISTAWFGHYGISLGSLFFYLVVVVVAIDRMSTNQRELVTLRREAADRADAAEQAASTDALTGLMNRHGLAQLDGVETQGRASALFIDLDGFKAINDSHGHLAGDEVLQTVARRLDGACGDSGVVARLGGDEFIVITTGDDVRNADQLAERVRALFLEPVVLASARRLDIAASVGVAHSESPRLDILDLLAASDRAMYDIKKTAPVNVDQQPVQPSG